ncbi:MAG: polysaccharide deacetylase family protein [Candidatus Gracilibacteria bacterium]|nr:polysaccharide deacetylase family protein [Candidatus Gracilibacteria bacterium]
MPNLKFFHVENFKKQLDFFEKEYGFVRKKDWEKFINSKENPPKGVVLTFDDGLIDHYNFVLPILKERNIWGIFFICTQPIKNRTILNVHKIHYLLGRYNSVDIYNEFKKILTDLNLISELDKINDTIAYKNRNLDNYSLIIKKINYHFDQNTQTIILDRLLRIFYLPNDTIWNNLYMNEKQIMEIKNAGNIIGGHSDSHSLLSKLDNEKQKEEILESNKYLSKILQSEIDCFSYPFGGNESYNNKTINILKESDIKYTFCVDSSDIINGEINFYEIPRYDCIEFEYGGIK